jgi:hypothetical protein
MLATLSCRQDPVRALRVPNSISSGIYANRKSVLAGARAREKWTIYVNAVSMTTSRDNGDTRDKWDTGQHARDATGGGCKYAGYETRVNAAFFPLPGPLPKQTGSYRLSLTLVAHFDILSVRIFADIGISVW